ncbi:MAG: hypothetical protein KAS30_05425, partial [Candidatus Diapherotrites archaeon]|nr:hypothetical protein [Candidatus Diapherotrites archaeon]
MKTINKITKISMLTLLMFVFALVNVPQASAVENPTTFYGTITAGGIDAPIDSIVKGYAMGEFDGNLTLTAAGVYGGSDGWDPKLSVGDNGLVSSGETINFYLKIPAMLSYIIATESALASGSTQNLNLTIPADDADPTLATGVNPSTLTYDNTTSTVDIASAGTCMDAAGSINYGMHATTPYRVSYSDGDSSPIATCDGALSYTVSTAWNTSSGISFTGTDGNYYCIKLECQDASGRITTSYSADNILYDVTKPVVASTVITPDPAKAGTVNVTVNYTETGSGLDYTLNPTVAFTPSGGTGVTVTKSTYAANQWTGTATVLSGHNNGTATLSVGGSTDKAGNTMNVDTTGSFVIDTIAPTAPVVVSPGSTTVVINIANKASQVIAGSAETDSTVKLYVDTVDSGLSTTATGGSYSFSNANLTTADIVSGTDYSTPKAVTLTATDEAGNESVVSTIYNYV